MDNQSDQSPLISDFNSILSNMKGSTSDYPNKCFRRFARQVIWSMFIKNESTIYQLNKCSSMFKRMTEINNTIQAIVTNTLE